MIEIENDLIEIIKKKQEYKISFSDIVSGFETKLKDFNPIENCFEIEKYFGNGGIVSARKKLLEDGIIKEFWLREYQTKSGKVKRDFKGLYVYIHEKTPIYVGISKGVLGRTLQHLKGHSHHTSTLAYNIGLIRYKLLYEEEYAGDRKKFDFKMNVAPAKDFLSQQKIAFIPIENDEEMYLFEIYCAMNLQCWLNRFETH